jgi:hypothetical protein
VPEHDEENIKQLFDDLPSRAQSIVLLRAAMRVFPYLLSKMSRKKEI